MPLTAVMVDDEIRGDPEEKCPRIENRLSRRWLKQAQEGILNRIFGGLRTSQATREKMLQIASMFLDEGR